jgi:hypothetical protein
LSTARCAVSSSSRCPAHPKSSTPESCGCGLGTQKELPQPSWPCLTADPERPAMPEMLLRRAFDSRLSQGTVVLHTGRRQGSRQRARQPDYARRLESRLPIQPSDGRLRPRSIGRPDGSFGVSPLGCVLVIAPALLGRRLHHLGFMRASRSPNASRREYRIRHDREIADFRRDARGIAP